VRREACFANGGARNAQSRLTGVGGDAKAGVGSGRRGVVGEGRRVGTGGYRRTEGIEAGVGGGRVEFGSSAGRAGEGRCWSGVGECNTGDPPLHIALCPLSRLTTEGLVWPWSRNVVLLLLLLLRVVFDLDGGCGIWRGEEGEEAAEGEDGRLVFEAGLDGRGERGGVEGGSARRRWRGRVSVRERASLALRSDDSSIAVAVLLEKLWEKGKSAGGKWRRKEAADLLQTRIARLVLHALLHRLLRSHGCVLLKHPQLFSALLYLQHA
jgi:hypothetical protein